VFLEPDSKYQPGIELRSDGGLTLKVKVRTPWKSNKWNSFSVQNIFPGPTDSESQNMLQFVRDCLLRMHYLLGLADLEEDPRKTWVCDILLTVAVKLGKEQSEMNQVRSLLYHYFTKKIAKTKTLRE
jgi:hypothetical protein